MLDYTELKPAQELEWLVRKFWVLDHAQGNLPAAVQYALPNTCFTLALVSGPGVIVDFPHAVAHLSTGAHFVGQLTSKVGVRVLPDTKAFMVQLQPWAAALLSACPMEELTNQVVALADLNRSLAQSLRHLPLAANHVVKEQLENVLARASYPASASALLAHCWQLLAARSGDRLLTIRDVATQTGYSARYLQQRFRQQLGLTPKQAQTILRLRAVIEELRVPPPGLSLTALAYKYGYADQAHFTKTYRQLMHGVPSKFEPGQHLLPFAG